LRWTSSKQRIEVAAFEQIELQQMQDLLHSQAKLVHAPDIGQQQILHNEINICVITAMREVPRKDLIFRFCLIHLKNSSICQRTL
jgi:hypothetical protein